VVYDSVCAVFYIVLLPLPQKQVVLTCLYRW